MSEFKERCKALVDALRTRNIKEVKYHIQQLEKYYSISTKEFLALEGYGQEDLAGTF